jgi:hypothetical protein
MSLNVGSITAKMVLDTSDYTKDIKATMASLDALTRRAAKIEKVTESLTPKFAALSARMAGTATYSDALARSFDRMATKSSAAIRQVTGDIGRMNAQMRASVRTSGLDPDMSGLRKSVREASTVSGGLALNLTRVNDAMVKVSTDGGVRLNIILSGTRKQIHNITIASKRMTDSMQAGFRGAANEANRLRTSQAGLERSASRVRPIAVPGGAATPALAAGALGASLGRTNWNNISGDMGTLARSVGLVGAALGAAQVAATIFSGSMQELENRFNIAFGEAAVDARAWSEEFATAAGVMAESIRGMSGDIQLVITALGFSDKAAAGMSKNLTQLAFDIASIRDIPVEEAFAKIRAGIVGEIEPLRNVGIILTETVLQATAVANGIAKQGEELSETQKVIARYITIMEQSTKAQGNWARESRELVTSLFIAKNRIQQLSLEVGNALRPKATEMVILFNRWSQALVDVAKASPEVVVNMAEMAVQAALIATAIGAIGLALPAVNAAIGITAALGAVAFTPFGAGVLAAVVGIATLTATIMILRETYEKEFEAIGKFMETFAEKSKTAFDKAIGYFETAKNAALDRMGAWQKATIALMGATVSGINQELGKNVAGGGGPLGHLLNGDPGAAASEVSMVSRMYKEKFGEIFDFIKSGAPGVAESLKGLVPQELMDSIDKIQKAFEQTGDPSGAYSYDSSAADFAIMEEEMRGMERAAQANAKAMADLAEKGQKLAVDLIPVHRVLFQLTDDLDALAAAGIRDVEVYSHLGQSIAKAIGDDAAFNIDNLIGGMQMLGVEGDAVIEGFQQYRDAVARAAEAQKLLQQEDSILSRFDPQGEVLRAFAVDLESLNAIGLANSDIAYRMGESYAKMAADAGLPISKLRELAEAFGRVAAGMEEVKSKDWIGEFASLQGSFDSIANSVSQLGGKFSGLAKVISAVSSAFGAASKAAQVIGKIGEISAGTLVKSFSSVTGIVSLAVDGVVHLAQAFGLLGDSAPEELTAVEKAVERVKQASDQWIDGLADAIVEFARTGEKTFKEFANGVIDELLKISLAELVIRPIVSGIGGMIPGFEKGGVVMAAKGTVISEPTAFNTPGGGMAIGSEYGQKEAVMPLTRDSQGRLSVHGGGGSNVVVNLNEIPQGMLEISERTDADGTTVIDATVAQSFKRLIRSGMFRSDFQQTFGLNMRAT